MKRSFVKFQSLIFDSLGKYQKDLANVFGFCPFFLCLCAVSKSAVFSAIPLIKYYFIHISKNSNLNRSESWEVPRFEEMEL
jgi:hypothetical protein